MSLHRIGGFTLCLSALTLVFAGCNKSSEHSPDPQTEEVCSAEVERLSIQADEYLLELKRLEEEKGFGSYKGNKWKLKDTAQKADATCEALFNKMQITPSCVTLSEIRGQNVTITWNNFVDDCNLAYNISQGKKSGAPKHH